MQALALDCLVRWREPALLAHQASLRKMINDATFRETLSLFTLDAEVRVRVRVRVTVTVTVTVRVTVRVRVRVRVS